MKSLILYGSPVKLSGSHHNVTRRLQPPYYVRSVLVDGDVVKALENAHPREGEIVLNTVPVEDGAIPFNPWRMKDTNL